MAIVIKFDPLVGTENAKDFKKIVIPLEKIIKADY